MSEGLEIALAPERLEEGTPEERACFGLFSIHSGPVALTAGIDWFVGAYRAGPLVSGFHAAEWFAWNWWRLRFEPRSTAPDWWRAHKMTAIGEGYVWPNLTIFSDGVRTTLISDPSVRPGARPFRYLGAPPCVLPSVQFEAAVDAFTTRMLGRLRECSIPETSLDRIWRDVLAERADPLVAKRRRLEALLGRDADATEDGTVDRLVADATELGDTSVQELAAEGGQGGKVLNRTELDRLAKSVGFDARPRDAVRLHLDQRMPAWGTAAAWLLGAEAARAVRSQERLGAELIDNTALARLAGVSPSAVGAGKAVPAEISFALDKNAADGKVVLRSKWEAGRRFELARLLADRIVTPHHEKLHVATRAHTYRQKMQRSFAAELLSPFEAVDAMLDGDYSPEKQQDVAAHFKVSDRTILTLLVNHHRLEREELDDLDADAWRSEAA